LEISSREFEAEFKRCIQRQVHHKVLERLLYLIKKWAESKEFKDDPQLSLIPSLYRSLQKEYRFPSSIESNGPSKTQTKLPSDPNVVTTNQEEEDIAKAIELSLKESGGTSVKRQESNSFYPTFDSEANSSTSNNYSQPMSGKEPYQVRALYDFEAAEENELPFKTGEVIVVLDDSDKNWWKGSNHRGEGLFPSNFVSTDLADPEVPSVRKTVQFDEEVKVKVLDKEPASIDEEKIDRLLNLLHEADPTGEKPDSDEIISLEEQCSQMGPLIDQELEKVDRTIASLNGVNTQLVQAMDLYHNLMRESVQVPAYFSYQQQPPPVPASYYPPQQHQFDPHHQPPNVDGMAYAAPTGQQAPPHGYGSPINCYPNGQSQYPSTS